MGYAFERQESTASNINRILSEQIEAAIGALENAGESKEETIHGVRKRIKKIRALLRLVRSEVKPTVFRRENIKYRAIGHQLSQLRDATVMIHTLEKLRQAHPDSIPLKVFSTLKRALVRRQGQVSREFFEDGTNMQDVIEALRNVSSKVPGLSKTHHHFADFRANLDGVYRRGRKALRVAAHEPSSHNFHEFRKEVKTIWYHTRLLQPCWPGFFAAYADELGRLAELLGDDHDVGVLAGEIESERLLLVDKRAKETLVQALHQQRTRLQEQIHPLANRLFAEKAGDFVGRYHLYWKLWQTEAKKETSSNEE